MFENAVITDTSQMEALCTTAAREPFVTVDTEFIREKTYFPKLCLVQIAGSWGATAIDPLAEGMDLTPLLALLSNPDVLKVFHAARQDLEIFYLLSGNVPAPVFDTQVAAQFAGFGESVSYSELVRKTVRVEIDKASRFTDWAHRPLTPRQLDYALSDVLHLREAYLALIKQLEKEERLSWVQEEMDQLAQAASYRTDPEEAWQRLKLSGMKPKQLAALRALAAWREREAQKKDVPRARILRDETLLEIAATCPHTAEELRHVRGTGGLSPQTVQTLVTLVAEALSQPPESWPRLPPRAAYLPVNGDTVALLNMLLAVQCRRHSMLPRLIATRDELEALAAGQTNLRVLHDWRHAMFGQYALKLLAGELKLSFDPKEKQVVVEGGAVDIPFPPQGEGGITP